MDNDDIAVGEHVSPRAYKERECNRAVFFWTRDDSSLVMMCASAVSQLSNNTHAHAHNLSVAVVQFSITVLLYHHAALLIQ
jgi:hypothetical protein